MVKLKLQLFLALFVVLICNGQTPKISLESIWSGSFVSEGINALHALKDGKRYTVLNFDRQARATSIDVYDYKTQKKIQTLVSSANLPALRYFSSYTFSKDEQYILLATNETSIYRYSSLGHYYVYSIKNKTATPVSSNPIQAPKLSPDAKHVAYVLDNNIYIKHLKSGKTEQITTDGKSNAIINGVTDWVYEEEFSVVRAFSWNVDSNQIAYLKFNEALVPLFSIGIYGNALYPNYKNFKYPKAGEQNAKVSLHIYNLNNKKTEQASLKVPNEYYIPRIQWTKAPNILSVQVLNRAQNKLQLWAVNSKLLASNLLLEEQDDAYVDVTDHLTFLNDNSFIWTSEAHGYNHIYYYNASGKLINQVTKGDWDVTRFYGYNNKTKTIFYQSVEAGSINRAVYSIRLDGGGKQLLSKQKGTNEAQFNADYSLFINTFSNSSTPPTYTLNSALTGSKILDIKDNQELLQKLSTYNLSKKDFSTLDVNGQRLNMWMLKPPNFDAHKTYPLLMHQYSGPGSQEVANHWNTTNDFWFQYLAQQGFIVACVDGRGTGYKGAKFKKVTQNNLGKLEVLDQIEAAKLLGSRSYIDANRIGIWGWSYGGFISSNCLFQANTVFKAAIAVAPVSSWRFYDTIYTERYLGLPQENEQGYDVNSPINHVNGLKGNFLLIHGSADDNVHVQNTMVLAEALIQANKNFDWAIYPDKNHGIYGGNTRLHLYKKMSQFIINKLGAHE